MHDTKSIYKTRMLHLDTPNLIMTTNGGNKRSLCLESYSSRCKGEAAPREEVLLLAMDSEHNELYRWDQQASKSFPVGGTRTSLQTWA